MSATMVTSVLVGFVEGSAKNQHRPGFTSPGRRPWQKICENPNTGLMPAGVWWTPIDRPAVETNAARGAPVGETPIMSVALPVPDEGVTVIHGGASNDQAHAGEVVSETDLVPPAPSNLKLTGLAA